MTQGMGNDAQVRIIAEQIAEAAIIKIRAEHQPMPPPPPSPPPAELPAPLKWVAGIAAAIITAGCVAMCIWVVSTLSDLQQTVTRIDERQKLSGDNMGKRLDDLEGRVSRIENANHEGPAK